MGAISDLYLFDARAYAERVVPSVRDFLLGRGDTLARGDRPDLGGLDLAPWLDAMAPDLSVGSYASRPAWPGDEGALEDVQMLFQRTVERDCLVGAPCYMGNAKRASYLLWHLDAIGVPHEHELRPLLHRLGECAAVWTHGSGGFSEGIHGWLSAEETLDLAVVIDDLAAFGPGFARSELPDPMERKPGEQLLKLRELAHRAVGRDLGLLWGSQLDGGGRAEVDDFRLLLWDLGDADTRAHVARELAERGDVGARAILQRVRVDPDERVRRAAAVAAGGADLLGLHPRADARELLERGLPPEAVRRGLADPDPWIRGAAASYGGCPELAEELVALLDDPIPGVRIAAVEGLGVALAGRDAPDVVSRLVGHLGEPEPLRDAVLVALGRIGDPSAAPGIVALLERSPYAPGAREALWKLRRAGAG